MLDDLKSLPRALYGHLAAPQNLAIAQSHTHDWLQLSYAIEGVIEVRTRQARFMVPPLFAVLIPAGISHGVRSSRNTDIRSLFIARSALPQASQRCEVLSVTPLLRELIREFSNEPVEYDESGPAGRLVGVLLDQIIKAPRVALMLPWPSDSRLQKICRHLQANPMRQKSLADFSGELHVSERTLSRLFMQEMGLSFRLWRQRLRLLHALPMLDRGDRVTDVAIACGYETLSSFIAAFRQQLACTPGEFIERARS